MATTVLIWIWIFSWENTDTDNLKIVGSAFKIILNRLLAKDTSINKFG